MTAFEFLYKLHIEWCHFQTREGRKAGEASKSELKRWCMNGVVVINGEKVKPFTEIHFPVESMVLFPNNPVTLR